MTRTRSTKAALAAVQDAILAITQAEHPLTLRAVYYRVLTAGLIDKGDPGYALVAREVAKLRFGHRLPWDYIIDGTRRSVGTKSYSSVGQAVSSISQGYTRTQWTNQPVRAMVWMEKDAMSSIVEPTTLSLHVPLHVARGQSSLTFVHGVATQLDPQFDTYVFGLYDHDDNGCKSWESIQSRMLQFAPDMVDKLHFKRLGVLPEHGLISHDHKRDKSGKLPASWEARGLREGFDPSQAIELDAYLTADIQSIVRDAITELIDADAWQQITRAQEADRQVLDKLAARYQDDSSGEDTQRIWDAMELRANTLRDSEALRTTCVARLNKLRRDCPNASAAAYALEAEISDAPTVSAAHSTAVATLRVSAAREALDEM